MVWFHLLAYFFSGVFAANFVPHFVSGVLGRKFPTPFSSPPFRGQSSPQANVLYGVCNLSLAYSLLLRIGEFDFRSTLHACVFGLGLTVWSLMIARSLSRISREQS